MLGLDGSICSHVDIRNSTKDFGQDNFNTGGDAIMTDNNNNNTTAAMIALACQTKATVGIRNGKSKESWTRFHDAITKIPEEWDALQALNALDIELYSFARDIGELDRLALEWAQ